MRRKNPDEDTGSGSNTTRSTSARASKGTTSCVHHSVMAMSTTVEKLCQAICDSGMRMGEVAKLCGIRPESLSRVVHGTQKMPKHPLVVLVMVAFVQVTKRLPAGKNLQEYLDCYDNHASRVAFILSAGRPFATSLLDLPPPGYTTRRAGVSVLAEAIR